MYNALSLRKLMAIQLFFSDWLYSTVSKYLLKRTWNLKTDRAIWSNLFTTNSLSNKSPNSLWDTKGLHKCNKTESIKSTNTVCRNPTNIFRKWWKVDKFESRFSVQLIKLSIKYIVKCSFASVNKNIFVFFGGDNISDTQ